MQRVAGLSADERAQVKSPLASVRLDRQRNSLRTGPTPAERIAALAALNRASDGWLAEFLGAERFGNAAQLRSAGSVMWSAVALRRFCFGLTGSTHERPVHGGGGF